MNYRQASPKEIAASLRTSLVTIDANMGSAKPTELRNALYDVRLNVQSCARWLESQDYGPTTTKQISTQQQDAEARLCTVVKTLLSLGADPDAIRRQVQYAMEETQTALAH